MDDIRPRCGWCNLSNPVYVAYHDAEWAVPSHDDHHLFEMLVLETFQAGLSWETILNKRERFRQAFDGFDIERIRRYDENKIAELMNDPGIIRNRRKIVATVGNANAFRDIQTSYGSFDDYIWRFTGRHVIYETGHDYIPSVRRHRSGSQDVRHAIHRHHHRLRLSAIHRRHQCT